MKRNIPPDVLNSNIEYCIAEYVRLERDRSMLRDHWFCGLSYYELADKYGVSLTLVKRVMRDGDDILLRAARMKRT